MDNPLISVISINYNSLDVTLQMLDSLQKSSYKNMEVIVVDNNSHIKPAGVIHDLYPEIKVIESNNNLGFAGGNNLALLQAAGDFIFYLNNDTELEENCLETLINSSLQLPDLGAISPKFHYYHTKNLIEYAGYSKINPFTARNKAIGGHQTDTGQYTGLIETSYTHGGGMLIPRRVIDKTGPMAEDFFLYYEEMDWCERIKAAGYKIYCQRDTIIYHKESASVGRLNSLKTYYLNRSRILFMRRNYGGVKLIPFILFFALVSVPKNVIYYTVKGQWDHLSAYFRSILWHFWPSRFTFKPVPSKN
jgi:GT2 family glycosyltransferase